ncbi:OmpA family protein [Sphingobacterium kyonggiense]|uniref:OmpA family protein n=1 Tax=Sphingobacterium kyonggiense TaxID=714075 RepID=A0ABP7YU33_9SPHI
MNKKLLAIALGLGISAASYGQTLTVKRDSVVTEDTDKYSVKTNRFFDNWFFGASAGGQMFFGDHNKQAEFGDRISPYFQGYVGKWFTPGIGVRAGVDGFKIVGLTQNGSHSTGPYDKIPWEGYELTRQEFSYWHVRADVLFNLTNIIAGYKADRFYNISPYAGLGWMVTTEEPIEREVSANIGLFNTFRLAKSLDLTLDIRGAMVNDRFDGEIGGRRNEGQLSTSLGLVYKFNKRDWNRPTTTTITETYDQAEFQNLISRLQKLEADNDALRKLLAEAKDSTITNINVKKNLLAAPILVTFPINKSTVSNEARVNLGFFAKLIKETNSEFVYSITGYADEGTGTPAINERLSKARAEAIYNVLVNEFNVNPKQLKTSHKGGVPNMFYNDPRLSRAVITIADILIK